MRCQRSLNFSLKNARNCKRQHPTLWPALVLVGRVGAVLYKAGLSAWMKETYNGYVGYSRGYVVVVNKEEI